jgi:DNA-binding NarL/FixJ family response regulator
MRPQQRPYAPAIMVVADVPILRCGVTVLLRKVGFHVIAESDTAANALHLLNFCSPSLVIADANLHGVTGLLLADVLKRSKPCINVVLLSHERGDATLIAAASAGVTDLLDRDADADALFGSVSCVLRGEQPVLSRVADRIAQHAGRRLFGELQSCLIAGSAAYPRVTAGEVMVLDYLVRGLTIAEAATRLNLAPGTVKNRLQRLRVRHGLHTQTQLLSFASQQGWITPVLADCAVGA